MLLKLFLLVAVSLQGVFAAPITPSLALSLKTKSTLDIFLVLEDTTPILKRLSSSLKSVTREQRTTAVANTLKSHAAASQTELLAFLAVQARSNPTIIVKSFWINNEVYVKHATPDLIQALASRLDVLEIREELKANKLPEVDSKAVPVARPNRLAEWGQEKIDISAAWAAGINGTGVRVGILDSGVRYTHEALYASFAGDYGWFNPNTGGELPVDSDGHGTHVMGTILGSGGIGAAPGAKWMACQNIPGAQAEDIICAEFMICPTRPNGTDADCSKAAHVVSNSWGYTGASTFYDRIFEAYYAAGIVVVFAAGNEGPTCTSLRNPGDSTHHAVVSVGATTVQDTVSSFSSFGPSRYGQIKPNIAAPGSDIRSSYITSDTAYASLSGTSMAAPHVAGVAALILSADPSLSVDEVTERLYRTAKPAIASTGRQCGGITETVYPNNHVGHGLLTATAALLKK